jgi:menaquinone-dependent protoporphyrinogen oxidase
MRVLVAYASRHGSSAEIAERIAGRLTADGAPAEARPAADVRDADQYDAFVIGSAAYMFHWLKDATTFVKRHRELLAAHPLWLFSSGPLGTETVDAEGNDPLQSSRPKEFEELAEKLHPRDERVFFGAWDPEAPPVGMAERMMKLVPAGTSPLPSGDFRDWAAIEDWAAQIARELRAPRTTTA